MCIVYVIIMCILVSVAEFYSYIQYYWTSFLQYVRFQRRLALDPFRVFELKGNCLTFNIVV